MHALILSSVSVILALGPAQEAPLSRAVLTDRPEALEPPLPVEDDAFMFAVFGDRTGGPAEGVEVLARAVEDTNLIHPDLVMTVGDLIQGYNTRIEWIPQMTQYRTIMDGLVCPWFPVAGNHDIYWRGPGRPPEEHERDYENFFGPLWYAFDHKGCRFIVLYTDEGDPETGRRSFGDPACQRMSDAQKSWLAGVLDSGRDKRHMFVFCHHPRWRGGRYGDDWTQVHDMLVDAGNVTAVFGGHVHRLQYDGAIDGIEYMSLAGVGAHLPEVTPAAGWLHHINLVTVRDDTVAMATIPVGGVIDPRSMTAQHLQGIDRLRASGATIEGTLLVDAKGSAQGGVDLVLTNPTAHDVEWTIAADSPDAAWTMRPDHVHQRVGPGEAVRIPLHVARSPGWSEAWTPPSLMTSPDVIDGTVRWTLPASHTTIPLRLEARHDTGARGHLSLDGSGHGRIDSDLIELPDGPLTVETWVRPRDLSGRRGLVAKTESSEFGLFASDAQANVHVHLGGRYVECTAASPLLTSGAWHHVAGVYDGQEVRLYVDGTLACAESGSGARTRNALPFIIGGDVDGRGQAVSLIDADLDEVRVSSVARYAGDRFTPERRFEVDEATVVLLGFDERRGPFLVDRSGRDAHAVLSGSGTVVED